MVAFWLVPAASTYEFFVALSRELADRFDAPRFEPHVTLHGGDIDRERALRVLCELPAAARYELEVEGIHSSPKYTKTLFVRFHLSVKLRQLRSALAEALDLESADNFDPHLSLLYKKIPQPAQEALASSIKIPFQQASFEGLKLIAHPPKITTRAEVEAWREIGQRCLTNASV